MADISKITTPDGTDLNIKDATARSDISNKVSKSGDTMTGDLRFDTVSSEMSTADGAGISWKETNYGDKFEFRPSFGGSDDSNYLALRTSTGGAGTDPSTKEKIKFYPSGTLELDGTRGGSWVSSNNVHQASISVNDNGTDGTRYDSIIASKCYNKGVISLGRISNEMDLIYVANGQTANTPTASVKFGLGNSTPRVNFGSLINGSFNDNRCYIDINNGSFHGKWNGVTDDHSTNNTTDTWVPVYNSNTLQHRVIPVAYNTAPLNISSVHALPSFSGTAIPSTQYLAYWNGAYGGGTNSNLRYTAVGALGNVATMAKGATLDGAGQNNNTIVPTLTGADGLSNIGAGYLRCNSAGWTNSFKIDCRWDTVALGMVIAASGSNFAHYYVYKGTNANWTYTYNGSISNTSSTYPQMTTSTYTSGGVSYARATFTGRNSSSWTFYAVWMVSNAASH